MVKHKLADTLSKRRGAGEGEFIIGDGTVLATEMS